LSLNQWIKLLLSATPNRRKLVIGFHEARVR
jgi:hypothetical protein